MKQALLFAIAVVFAVGLLGLAFMPMGPDTVAIGSQGVARSAGEGLELGGAPVELSNFSGDAIGAAGPSALPLLFIHHSCGGQLFAQSGPEEGEDCIYGAHPNGGDLRSRLASNGYEIHEASYGSEVGQDTDLFHWLPKFRDKMERVLRTDDQDETYPEGSDKRNRIVMFKSCYPNNHFVGEGAAPGNPAGPELTLANAKATLAALLPEFAKQPELLFVYVTAPALAPAIPRERAWKVLAKRVLGKPSATERYLEEAALARRFHDWARAPEGWLKGYAGKNVVVFDYFDVLTGQGQSNLSIYGSVGGRDSHPSSEGNRLAAEAFVPFLNRATRRLGLAP
jgi:hypothetical protein